MTPPDRLGRAGWPVACVVLVLPLVWWAGAVLAGGWVPEGDFAVAAVRTHDVFGPHTPLLGMPSTSGQAVEGVHAHHPGPLQFQLLAPLYALSGYAPWALVVGSLLLLAGLMAVTLAAADRAAGPRGWQAMTVVSAVVVVAVGAALVTPWNPWPAVFALGAAVSTAWAILTGHGRWWPAFVVTVSLAAQAHVAIAPVSLVLGVTTLVASVALWRRGRLEVPQGSIALAAVLGLAVWAAPLADVARNEPDNLDLLLEVARAGGGGPLGAVLLVAAVAAVVWWTGRRGTGLTSGRPSSIVALTLIGAIVLVASATRAGEGREGYVMCGVAVPLTLVAWLGVGACRRSRHRRFITGALIVAAVVGLLFLPRGLADDAKRGGTRAVPVVEGARALVRDTEGPIAVETSGGLAWMSLGAAVYAALLADGRDVYFDPRTDGVREDDFRLPRHLAGPHHRLLVQSHAGEADAPPEGAVVERVELDVAEGAELAWAERYVDLVLEER